MNRFNKMLVILVVSLDLFLTIAPGLGTVTREQVNSIWTEIPPIVDGVFGTGEWSSPQIVMEPPSFPLHAYVYFRNDASNLYYLVDVVGDNTDSKVRKGAATFYDESLLVFNFVNQVGVRFNGQKGKKSVGRPFTAAIGFDGSPNSPEAHRIFEFSVPLRLIRAKPGQNLSFCSPAGFGGVGKTSIAFDADTGKDNIWPLGLNTVFEYTWAVLVLDKAPTETTTITSSTTSQIPEFPVAVIGLVAALGATLCILKRDRNRFEKVVSALVFSSDTCCRSTSDFL